jgi:prevent-host-death family protein
MDCKSFKLVGDWLLMRIAMQQTTKIVGAFEAKTKFSELLERVRKGEEIIITRHATPVARLVPFERSSAGDIREAFERMERIRSRNERFSVRQEKLSYRELIEEGRRR